MRYENDHYVIAPELMAKPAPTEEELRTLAAELREDYRGMVEDEFLSRQWPAYIGLWEEMLDLLYAGQEDAALQLFDLAWPPEVDGKDEELEDFAETVVGSFFWRTVYGQRPAAE